MFVKWLATLFEVNLEQVDNIDYNMVMYKNDGFLGTKANAQSTHLRENSL